MLAWISWRCSTGVWAIRSIGLARFCARWWTPAGWAGSPAEGSTHMRSVGAQGLAPLHALRRRGHGNHRLGLDNQFCPGGVGGSSGGYRSPVEPAAQGAVVRGPGGFAGFCRFGSGCMPVAEVAPSPFTRLRGRQDDKVFHRAFHRNMAGLLAILSVMGFLNAGYFVLAYYGRVGPMPGIPNFCRRSEENLCLTVLRTPYARVFGPPNAALGVFFYLANA